MIFFALLIIIVVLLNSITKVYQKKKEAGEVLARMQQEQETLIDREQFLSESLKRLSTEEGLEFEIRKKLNVAKVGESVAIIVDETESSPDSSPNPSLWQKIKNFFSGLFE